jgi:hypothetical protein
MPISQELEDAIHGSIHSAGAAADLIDLCNGSPFTGSVVACSLTNVTVATAMSAASILATNLSASSVTAINLKVSTAMSVASILGTNISCANLTATVETVPTLHVTDVTALGTVGAATAYATALTAAAATIPTLSAGSVALSSAASINSALATNVSIGGGLSIGGNFVKGQSIFTSGGISGTDAATKWSTVQQLTNGLCFLSVTNATNNFFRLPAAAIGLGVNAINIGSSAVIIPAASAVSCYNSLGTSTTGYTLASGGANSNAINVVADGSRWWPSANV